MIFCTCDVQIGRRYTILCIAGKNAEKCACISNIVINNTRDSPKGAYIGCSSVIAAIRPMIRRMSL